MLIRPYVLPLVFLTTSAFAQIPPIQINADLSEAPRKLLHAEIDIPVSPGPLTLTTPKWIPGHHSPSGPVADITGVVFTADGKTLPWRRDDIDLYEFHLTVPAGVNSIHAHLDSIAASFTPNQAVLEWEKLLLYPAGVPVREIPIQASVNVPAGWGIGTSLTPISAYDPQHPAGGIVRYAATTVEMLEDSPIMTGRYFHEYALAPEITPKHYIDVFGEASEDVEIRPSVLDHWNRLVHEAGAMYGAPHYRSYHFLLALRGARGGGGLEHHESSDNSLPEKALTTDDNEMVANDLLPHEFTHSWNGKYRRPAGLATPDYATPMKGVLLWVYEVPTADLGAVLAKPMRRVSRRPSPCPLVRSAVSHAGACTGPVFAADARPRWIWLCRCARGTGARCIARADCGANEAARRATGAPTPDSTRAESHGGGGVNHQAPARTSMDSIRSELPALESANAAVEEGCLTIWGIPD